MPEQPDNRKFWPGTFFWPSPALPLGIVFLLIGSFLYVWLRVEPALEYHAWGPFFYRRASFLDEFLDRPGGLANYAGVFLAQMNCRSWLGALEFVVAEGVAVLLALVSLARISGKRPGFVALAPALVLLLLRNRYDSPLPALTIGLVLALTTFAVQTSLPWRRPWVATVISGLLSNLLFLVAGLWSALLFAVLFCLFQFRQTHDWRGVTGCLGLALLVPLVSVGVGSLELPRLLNPWSERVDWELATVLYLSVPIAGAVLAWDSRRSAAPGLSQSGGGFSSRLPGRAVVTLVLLLWAATLWLRFDGREKLLATIDYEASRDNHQAVVAAARKVRVLTEPAQVRLRRALYHTGLLAEELFSFQNLLDQGTSVGIAEDCRAQSEVLLELGLLNDAEHMAYEALLMEGERPDVLRLLARIHSLKGQPRAAQVFLNVLSLIPFQGERANEFWPSLPQIPGAEQAWLARMRPRLLTEDVLHEGLPMERLLETLLASNPTNQMAFEYVVAGCLLNLNLQKAVEHLRLLEGFSYPRIPKAYEEAVLLYEQVAGARVELKGRTIRPETVERFRRFKAAAQRFRGWAADQAAIAAEFGDTYWYYYFATRSRRQADEGHPEAQ